MDTNILSLVSRLSNQELVAKVKVLAQQEREATVVLIAHLAVLDERRLYLAEGCSSLFIYCTQVLHLSEHAAYGRIEAARAARKFPVILEMLSSGSVNLTTVGLLVPHFTPENHRELLEAARDRSKRQVEELVARLWPQPAVPATVRRLPGASPMAAPALMPQSADSRSACGGAASDDAPPLETGCLPSSSATPMRLTTAPPARRAVVEPLAPQQYRVQFTASAETYEKLRLAQEMLRHQIPNGDLGQIMDRALSELLEALARQKFAATNRPRDSRERSSATEPPRESHERRSRGTVPRTRHIPAEVKRRVWLRDGGRCAFLARNGRRCSERAFLEFHHVVPYSTGGEATAENIQLRCRAHNAYESGLLFGLRSPMTSTWSGPSRGSVQPMAHVVTDSS